MSVAALIAVYVVAAAHVAFFLFESVLWSTPRVRRIFAQTVESAETTRVLALNQGCYNAGVAALLVWAAVRVHREVIVAQLVFVIAMGLVGGVTAKKSILVAQALPAAIALALVWMR